MQRVLRQEKIKNPDWRRQLSGQLCEPFSAMIKHIDDMDAAKVTELRFRCGHRPVMRIDGREREISDLEITSAMLTEALSFMCDFSIYSKQNQLSEGFITLKGGYRAGIAGTVIGGDGGKNTITNISGINIRITREIIGCGEGAAKIVFAHGVHSTLIISPPGMGKTTLLRDIIRILSNKGIRIALADERSEIAAMFNGTPSMDVGRCTDIMDGCEKHIAISMLLRAMTPDVIAADEIGRENDADALCEAALSGVKIIATAHGSTIEEALKKIYMRPVAGLFERFILLGNSPGKVLFAGRKEEIAGD